jgi:hypothetical protein
LVINKNLTASFNKQLLVFPSIENKTVLDSIYKEANVKTSAYDANSLKSFLTQQMQKVLTILRKAQKNGRILSKPGMMSDMKVVSQMMMS